MYAFAGCGEENTPVKASCLNFSFIFELKQLVNFELELADGLNRLSYNWTSNKTDMLKIKYLWMI